MSAHLIDIELLERLQQHFGKANNVYLACLDRERNMLTPGLKEEDEIAFYKNVISKDSMDHLWRNVEMSQVEAIVEE